MLLPSSSFPCGLGTLQARTISPCLHRPRPLARSVRSAKMVREEERCRKADENVSQCGAPFHFSSLDFVGIHRFRNAHNDSSLQAMVKSASSSLQQIFFRWNSEGKKRGGERTVKRILAESGACKIKRAANSTAMGRYTPSWWRRDHDTSSTARLQKHRWNLSGWSLLHTCAACICPCVRST